MKNNPVLAGGVDFSLSKFIALIILDFYAQLDVNSSSDLITLYSIHYEGILRVIEHDQFTCKSIQFNTLSGQIVITDHLIKVAPCKICEMLAVLVLQISRVLSKHQSINQ